MFLCHPLNTTRMAACHCLSSPTSSAGPVVVGITVSAIAVGAAFSAGALAFTALQDELVVLSGIGGLMSFGVVAVLGAALVVPKMVFSALLLVSFGPCGAQKSMSVGLGVVCGEACLHGKQCISVPCRTALQDELIVLTGVEDFMTFGVVAALGAALVVPKMIFSALSLVSTEGHRS